jgi:hypothetical protein
MNEYWIVTDNRTGRVIAHCGDINDAMMLVALDSHYRSYSRHRVLMDQVINVTSTTDKQLPGQLGLPVGKVNILEPHKIRLPEGQQQPVKV